MSIKVSCPKCPKTYTVSESNAGKKFRCKGCSQVISVPKPKPKPKRKPKSKKPIDDDDWGDEFDDDYGTGDDYGSEDEYGANDEYDEWSENDSGNDDEYEDYEEYEDYGSTRKRQPAKSKKKHKQSRRSDRSSFEFISQNFDFTSPLIWIGVPIGFHAISFALGFLHPLAGLFFSIPVLILLIVLSGIAGICSLIDAFTEDVSCGLLCLFIPPYALYFTFSRWEQQKQSFMCGMILFNVIVTPIILGAVVGIALAVFVGMA